MRNRGRAIWKKICSFFRAIRQLLFLAFLVIVAFLTYLYFYGLPQSWKAALLNELANQGVHIQIESIYFDPLQGVVARGIRYKPQPNEEISIREMDLKVNLLDMVRRRFAFDFVEFDGSDIQIITESTKTPLIIHKTGGRLRFAKNGIIYLESVIGELFDIHLELNGRLDVSPKPSEGTKEKPNLQLESIQEVLEKIRTNDPGSPIRIHVRFDSKISDPSSLRCKADIESGPVTYAGLYQAQRVVGKFEIVNQNLSVPTIMISDGKGKVSFWGMWDMRSGAVQFEFMNDLNPESLIMKNATAQKKNPLHDFKFGTSPEFWFKGNMNISPQGGGWKSLKGEASFSTRELTWRNHLLRKIHGSAQISDGKVHFPQFNLVQDFGRMTSTFTYDIPSYSLDFDFNSSLDLAMVMKVLYPSDKNWFQTVKFNKPPTIQLKGTWKTHDPNGLQASGNIDWKDWSSRGVLVKGTKAKVEIKGRRFYFQDFHLVREEGEASGNFDLDFSAQNTTLDVVSHVHFADLAKLISPKTEELFSPYRFPVPPRMKLKGVVYFENDALNNFTADIEADQFKLWKFSATRVTALVRSFRKSLEIARYSSNFYDGLLEGDAVFDFTSPEQDWAFHCKVEKADFDQFTHALWEYREVHGYLTGWAHMSGTMKSSQKLKGYGEVKMEDGVLWKIPLFGELSKFIPILGEHKITKGTANFTVADEKVNVDDVKMSAGIMSLTAKGIYKLDESIDFVVQGHFLRAFLGIGYVLDPFTKAFEYHVGGKLNDRIWKPRFIPKELLLQFGNDQPPDKGSQSTNPPHEETKEP